MPSRVIPAEDGGLADKVRSRRSAARRSIAPCRFALFPFWDVLSPLIEAWKIRQCFAPRGVEQRSALHRMLISTEISSERIAVKHVYEAQRGREGLRKA